MQASAEPLQSRPGHVDPPVMAQLPIFPEHHLRKGAVDVHSYHPPHQLLLSSLETGAAGDTTPTDPRSRRNRAGRRGGQLLTRALSSSNTSACPHLRAPGAPVPDGLTIRHSSKKLKPVTRAPQLSYRLPTRSRAPSRRFATVRSAPRAACRTRPRSPWCSNSSRARNARGAVSTVRPSCQNRSGV